MALLAHYSFIRDYYLSTQDLGYPQQPTLLLIDNTVAIGSANDTMNKKRSKSMDMRFFWLRAA